MKSVPQIEELLNEFSINNYIITEDFQVVVFGNVNLNGKIKGKKLPISFKMAILILVIIL